MSSIDQAQIRESLRVKDLRSNHWATPPGVRVNVILWSAVHQHMVAFPRTRWCHLDLSWARSCWVEYMDDGYRCSSVLWSYVRLDQCFATNCLPVTQNCTPACVVNPSPNHARTVFFTEMPIYFTVRTQLEGNKGQTMIINSMWQLLSTKLGTAYLYNEGCKYGGCLLWRWFVKLRIQ